MEIINNIVLQLIMTMYVEREFLMNFLLGTIEQRNQNRNQLFDDVNQTIEQFETDILKISDNSNEFDKISETLQGLDKLKETIENFKKALLNRYNQ